jgi:lipid-binding SYLF domain-containing protein
MRNKVKNYLRIVVVILCAAWIAESLVGPPGAHAAEPVGVEKDAEAALEKLYVTEPEAKTLAEKARAILVFPNIFKAGFLGAAHYGEGVLFQGGQVAGHYNSFALSFGLQAGVQSYGYAMFLMSDEALHYLDRSSGWEIGVGPSVVVVNTGIGKSLTNTTLRADVYVFIFNQQGLMAGLALEGSKITKIK